MSLTFSEPSLDIFWGYHSSGKVHYNLWIICNESTIVHPRYVCLAKWGTIWNIAVNFLTQYYSILYWVPQLLESQSACEKIKIKLIFSSSLYQYNLIKWWLNATFQKVSHFAKYLWPESGVVLFFTYKSQIVMFPSTRIVISKNVLM